MSVETALAMGRAAAERRMRDQCLIERKTGRTFNDTTGQYTDVWMPVYTGRCRFKAAGGSSDTTTGEAEVTLRRYGLDLPWDTAVEIKRQDRATVTLCVDDAWAEGRQMEVVDVGLSGATTARRISIEDRT